MAKKRRPKKDLKRKKQLKRKVLQFFKFADPLAYNYKQVSAGLAIEKNAEKKLVLSVLEELSKSDLLEEVRPGKYKSHLAQVYITGKVDFTRSGSAYIVSPDIKEDVFVKPRKTGTALHGDTVKVMLSAKKRNKKPEGEIVDVVKRAKLLFSGTIELTEKFAFLIPDDRKMHVDIYISLDNLNGAKNGDKALATITDWPKKATSPFGKIIEVLGKPGNPKAEMLSVIANSGTPLYFPEKVLKDAKNIPTQITKEEISLREDFRETTTFTIDPEDAKDFDDAISFREKSEGVFEIGVHIADVSHYLEEGSVLDKEAFARATSIYMVDRVVPMLPEVLSNNLCSLRPNEEKLCYAVIFDINKQGKILDSRIVKTVINSNRRFIYEEVQEIIEGAEGDYKKELLTLNSIAKTLRNKRLKYGSIAFESSEVRFKLDEQSRPIDVYFKTQKDAHKLIEEFMLLANQAVAKKIGIAKNGTPKTFVYRIHDVPDPEKIATFSKFVGKLGYKINNKNTDALSSSINNLLKDVKGKGEQAMIESLAIRSMAKAEYSTNNIGHYGLAFSYYSHFTSPIRRYPDVITHRLLFKYLSGEKSANKESTEAACKHCSERERKAIEAERESTKFYQVLFMEDKVGRAFDGVISGISEWGLFVEIKENGCEGMIRVKDLNDDYYSLDEENYRLVGNNNGKVFQLGDSVEVLVTKADIHTKEIDLELV